MDKVELRIRDIDAEIEWRIMYAIDDIANVVLEIWKKTTRTTPQRVIDVCHERLQKHLAAKRGE
jgi:phage-related protein